MNEKKLKQLFAWTRNEPAPAPPKGFAADVLRAIRRELPAETPRILSLFDLLNRLFPRLALAAVAVIVLCIAVDYVMTMAGVPDLRDGLAQISAQWLLTPGGFGS